MATGEGGGDEFSGAGGAEEVVFVYTQITELSFKFTHATFHPLFQNCPIDFSQSDLIIEPRGDDVIRCGWNLEL